MSKLYKKYCELKNKNKDTLYLFKTGIFYLFIDNDAKLMSEILKLKLSNLNSNIVKCGFPICSLEKYLCLLNNSHYTVKIIDNIYTDMALSQTDYINNEKIKKIAKKISSTNIDNLSIIEAYSFLYDIQKYFSNI